MFRKIAIYLLTLLLVFALVSCGENGSEAETDPETEAGLSIPTVTEKTLTLKQNEGAIVDISASYPIVAMQDTAIADRINQQIKAYVDSLYGEYETGTLTNAADSIYSKMQYEVTLCTEEKLSIHIFCIYNRNGLQYVYDRGFTFDVKTGELITLTDLYTEEQIDRAIRAYFPALDQTKYPTMFQLYLLDDVAQNFLDWFSSESALADSAFEHDFYLSEDCLYLFAGLYKGYTDDIRSPFSGDRAFIAEIPFTMIPAAE